MGPASDLGRCDKVGTSRGWLAETFLRCHWRRPTKPLSIACISAAAEITDLPGRLVCPGGDACYSTLVHGQDGAGGNNSIGIVRRDTYGPLVPCWSFRTYRSLIRCETTVLGTNVLKYEYMLVGGVGRAHGGELKHLATHTITACHAYRALNAWERKEKTSTGLEP